MRLRGRDPEFVVTPPPSRPDFGEVAERRSDASPSPSQTTQGGTDEGGEGGTSRITLRLPENLKVRVEDAAMREGLSVNSWLVRAIATALEPKDSRSAKRDPLPGATVEHAASLRRDNQEQVGVLGKADLRESADCMRRELGPR